MKIQLPTWSRIKETLENYRRVLIVARKPTLEEFKVVAKVNATGLALIGSIGFVIYLISVLLGA